MNKWEINREISNYIDECFEILRNPKITPIEKNSKVYEILIKIKRN